MAKENEIQDLLYNLIAAINASSSEDMYYSIAQNILLNLSDMPKININDLAELCYTSPATISRFSKSMHCSSFQDLKNQLQISLSRIQNEINFPDEMMETMLQDPSKTTDLLIDLQIKNLQELKDTLNAYEVDELCHLIHSKKKLHLYGFQFNKIVASDFQLKMFKLGKLAYAFIDRGVDNQRLELLDEDSLAIIISVRAKDEAIFPIIEKVHESGATTILLTLTPNTNAQQISDKTIVLPAEDLSYTNSSTAGSSIFKTYLDLIYLRYGILYKYHE